ncbi:hypothetical protein C8R46DRAFT_1148650 [Mycena filopes]|nr:hypothetical protein C8R46DRAFT_1148650 [Mycena filopes]
MHPNVLGIEGISSSRSSIQFIAYEDVQWKDATIPLAMALGDELSRSVTLGFKLIAGLSSAMHYLSLQGVSFASLSVKNFDIFCDVDDRFLLSINPSLPSGDGTNVGVCTDSKPWDIFGALVRKTFMSINRLLYDDEVERDTSVLDVPTAPNSSLAELPRVLPPAAARSSTSDETPEQPPSAPPRREYVWRSMHKGPQSLAAIARPIELQLQMKRLNLNRVTSGWRQQRPHRCAGYLREEITLAPVAADSAVVLHDTPDASEKCSICRQIVNTEEKFRCRCAVSDPGSGPTVQCSICRCWMHRKCYAYVFDCTIIVCGIGGCRPSNSLSAGILVFYWDGNGRAVYGVCRRIRHLRDQSIVVDVRTTSNHTITLPISSVQKVC